MHKIIRLILLLILFAIGWYGLQAYQGYRLWRDVGFDVYEPTYLPAGFKSASKMQPYKDGEGKVVVTAYYENDEGTRFTINQNKVKDAGTITNIINKRIDTLSGSEIRFRNITRETIAGNPGYSFITPANTKSVVWFSGELEFTLLSNELFLSLEEVNKIASSMRKL